jgi:hypothetical protein
MSNTGGKSIDLVVWADHGQFYLQDALAHDEWARNGGATDPDLAPAGWTHEAVQYHRIGLEPHSIAVGTAGSDSVDVKIREHRTAPAVDAHTAEHVVEADLDVPGGEVSVYGPADDPGTERRFSVAAGRYRARISYIPTTPTVFNEHESGDHFCYLVDLWPSAAPADLVVLKQGPVPWAG